MRDKTNINKSEDFHVDFIGIGAPKCGTTWIYKCLNEHPDIHMSSKKETNYFYSDPELGNYKYGLEWYKKFYKDVKPNQIIGEYSTHYMYYPDSYNNIYKTFPDVKIIVSIRNPAEMAYSMYKWQKANYSSFHIPSNFEDAIKTIPEYIEKCKYYKYLKNFYDIFPHSNIHVVIFEEIIENPDKVLNNLYSFLGVDRSFSPSVKNTKVNVSKMPRSKMIANISYTGIMMLNRIGLNKLAMNIQSSTSLSKIYSIINKKTGNHPALDKDIKDRLSTLFKEDNEKLAKLINKDLSIWNMR